MGREASLAAIPPSINSLDRDSHSSNDSPNFEYLSSAFDRGGSEISARELGSGAPLDPSTMARLKPYGGAYNILESQESVLGGLLITPDRLDDVTLIASGDRSQIFSAKLKEIHGTSRDVVVKQLVRAGNEFRTSYRLHQASITRALKTWGKFKHPNVLELLGCSENADNEIHRLILPYLVHGNVRQYLAQGTAGIAQRLKFVRDLAAGLDYLHGRFPPIYRSNLNPLGILVDNNLNAVLGAFASFELYYDSGDLFEDHRFTSPEVVSEGSAILTDKQPFENARSSTAVLISIINREVPGQPETLLNLVPDAPQPEHAITLRLLYSYLPSCWDYEPTKRPSISLLRHEAIKVSYGREAGRSVVATLDELAHLLIAPHRLRINEGSELGAGTYGEVVLGTLDGASSIPKDVAVKRLKAVGIRGERVRLAKRLARELKVWAKIQHPNVVELLGYYLDEKYESPLLISTLMPNGNILEYIERAKPVIRQRIGFVKGITAGLACLHNLDPAICHADLKPANVLIDLRLNAVLCDFGLASFIGDSATAGGLATTTTLKGTPRYMSPELQLGEDSTHNLESDVWAWACTVFQVITGNFPYAECPAEPQLCVAIVQKQPPGDESLLLPGNFGDIDSESASALQVLHSIIPSCWDFEPQCRPSMRGLLSQVSDLCSGTVNAPSESEDASLGRSNEGVGHVKASEVQSDGLPDHDEVAGEGKQTPLDNHHLQREEIFEENGRIGHRGTEIKGDSCDDQSSLASNPPSFRISTPILGIATLGATCIFALLSSIAYQSFRTSDSPPILDPVVVRSDHSPNNISTQPLSTLIVVVCILSLCANIYFVLRKADSPLPRDQANLATSEPGRG